MELYAKNNESSVFWPEPLESTWQLLGGERARALAPKLPHLGLADILFMSAVMSLPRARRPWGIITWLAKVFLVSRPGLYALTKRVRDRLLPAEAPPMLLPEVGAPVTVTSTRLARTILTANFPGKMAIRPTQQLLSEAFDQSRSVGWLSQLLTAAGEQAGQVLASVDTSPLEAVIVARDETFFHGQPLLLVIEPVSRTILLAVVAPDRQAETWAIALLMSQEQGATFKGIVEDMARMYPKSQKEIGLNLEVQKDVWHIERDGAQVRRDLERAAFRATKRLLKLEKKLLQQWDDTLFEQHYIPAVAKEERLYQQHDAFDEWLGHLYDALETVDWRSGEIRDRTINEWLLEETLTAMGQIDHPRVKKWVKTLRRHQTQLLTSLDWLAASLIPYRQKLESYLESPADPAAFLHIVARCWRLRQALINGHRSFRDEAELAEWFLQELLADDAHLQELADRLWALLDAACRTSSLIENINGLLKPFLHAHRAFRNQETLQSFLNLFTLWHNMRVFQRGKHQGKSPYQLAGIDPCSDDWLALLGYPAE